jgi:hypothetical protein
MTVVNIKVQVPGNGADVPAEGSLRWEPTARRTGPDGALILVDSFITPLVAGVRALHRTPGQVQAPVRTG